MSEHDERLPVGPKGAKGDPGMPRGQRRAIVFLFLLSVVMSVGAYVAATAYYRDSQAAQQRQGQALERKLCTTLGRLASREPPAGAPGANPSRAYLQWQHDTLAQLGPDIGCRP